MNPKDPSRRRTAAVVLVAALLVASLATSCGGGGGSGTGDTLQGMILVDFIQSGQDNLPLNRTLEFIFSSLVDPATVGPSSMQIRVGPANGLSVDGDYVVQGERVFFEPRLPGLCDLSDGGLQPDTEYRVTLIGSPEEFAIRNLAGDALQATISMGFSTRPDTDPELFEDQIPGSLPTVVDTTPEDGTPSVLVGASNQVEIIFSENLNPCSVSETTVTLYQYATGHIVDGFVPPIDAAPSDDFSWGSGTPTIPSRRILCSYDLKQDLLRTRLTLTPNFGEFPDNALLVCQVTNQVKDFGGNPLVPFTFSFTTENRPPQTKARVFEFDGDVPIITAETTAEVNTARAPSRVQAYLLVAGDGDNGTVLLAASGPDTVKGPPGCTPANVQVNDSIPDDFDPPADVLLSTGGTRNTCNNAVDGSTAVVFEYRSFRIRSGVVVRLTGVNAAIILVRGEVVIEAGGRLLVRGDNQPGSPNPNGSGGVSNNETATPAGGVGVAGGGSGGIVTNTTTLQTIYGGNGVPGFGSPDFGLAPGTGGSSPVRVGGGRGAVGITTQTYPPPPNRQGVGGGGGGHGKAGAPGTALGSGTSPFALMDAFVDGAGGGIYGESNGSMLTPTAGSGGGAGGTHIPEPWQPSGVLGTGGGGGAGGGFVDLTASATIRVFGAIDANGGRGGNGANANGVGGFFGSGGGGGGGSGGGIRLLTPDQIVLGSTTVLTAIGGLPGASGFDARGQGPQNFGGAGGLGRLTLEDHDGVIEGIGGATVSPNESQNSGGENAFYRGVFNGARFKGGGTRPSMLSDLLDIGPFSPTYWSPSQDYGAAPGALPPLPRIDFVAGVPQVASRGIGAASIFIEMQGYATSADGTPNLNLPSGWKSVGYFVDSGSEPFPNWVPDAKPPGADVPPGDLLPGNTGDGIASLNGLQFVEMRITFFLPSTMGVFDPGPYVDRWSLWFSYDQ